MVACKSTVLAFVRRAAGCNQRENAGDTLITLQWPIKHTIALADTARDFCVPAPSRIFRADDFAIIAQRTLQVLCQSGRGGRGDLCAICVLINLVTL